ncbi:MAG: mechanosensitive ion channel family protein [Acholeplasmataceae bacterium]|jgi:small conductance mechanosensitive channel|nr:mechanosensitive ion channel family protein [Acholeplasmataceae bacterium]
MNFKNKSKSEKIRFIIFASIIFIFILLGSLADIIFSGTTFAKIINNSIGKFFNILVFFENNYVIILESITILVFVWILNKAFVFLIYLITKKGHRSNTIGKLLSSSIRYLSIIVAFFLILSAWGVQTPTLLAGAGIIGLALSFGAQSLIEDIFAGLFIIFEKQFVVGDIIQVHDMRGTVTEIGIRITKIEDLNGDVLIINNSDIRGAVNTSSSLSIAICDIAIEYGANLEKIEEIVKSGLGEIRKEIPLIKEGPFYLGVEQLADSSVVIRVIAKTEEFNRHKVRRALNREMKLLFDRNSISIPFPQLTLHQEKDEN